MIPLLFEYMLFLLFFVLMWSYEYFGAVPVVHLKVDVNILYSILCSLGSQCNSFNAYDELEDMFLFKMSLAHIVCKCSRFLILFCIM